MPRRKRRVGDRLCPRQFHQFQHHRKHHRPQLMGTTKPTGTDKIPCTQRTTTTKPTHQNRWQTTLNQQVPGSSPGRRTKVVKLYELLYPNCRAHWATTRRFKHFRRISNSKPVAIHIATCGFETVARLEPVQEPTESKTLPRFNYDFNRTSNET